MRNFNLVQLWNWLELNKYWTIIVWIKCKWVGFLKLSIKFSFNVKSLTNQLLSSIENSTSNTRVNMLIKTLDIICSLVPHLICCIFFAVGIPLFIYTVFKKWINLYDIITNDSIFENKVYEYHSNRFSSFIINIY